MCDKLEVGGVRKQTCMPLDNWAWERHGGISNGRTKSPYYFCIIVRFFCTIVRLLRCERKEQRLMYDEMRTIIAILGEGQVQFMGK